MKGGKTEDMDNFNYNYNNQGNAGTQNSNMYGGQGRIKCPTCGSTNLQYTTESETKVETSGGGYSGSKGCLGFLLFGPFGLLCGNCGKSQKTTVTNLHKHFWVCSDCGCKFPSLEDLQAEIQRKRDALKSAPQIIIAGILLIAKVLEYLFQNFETKTYYGVFGFIFSSIIAIIFQNLVSNNSFVFSIPSLIIGIILFILGFVVAYKLGDK